MLRTWHFFSEREQDLFFYHFLYYNDLKDFKIGKNRGHSMGDKTERNIEQNIEEEIGISQNSHRPTFSQGMLFGFLVGLAAAALIAAGIGLGWSHRVQNSPANPTAIQEAKPGEAKNETLLTKDFIKEVNTVYEEIGKYFLYDFDNKKLQDGMLQGMLSALEDPYSVYYNESALESFTNQTSGEYYGIGCIVSQNRNTGIITVVKPYVGSPAYESGLLPGDIVFAVNDTEVTGVDVDQVVNMIRGAEGSTVKLTLIREGENDYIHMDVERRQVEINTVEHEMLEDQIGYIAVSSFDGVTPAQFKTAFEDLKSRNMKGLVIDMRGNGGGLLTAVEEMLDYMLPEGVIFYAKDKYGNKYLEYTSDQAAALDVPLAILVNGNTASAAEVFSGNVQEFGLGTLVGTTTFGKGIMQNTYSTNPENTRAVKLTVADYYIHSDRNIHKIGITPDVEVELDPEVARQVVITKAEDNQLQEALRVVREQLQQQ